ncbi:MAG: hypothetical protein ABRQ39_19420 [Candidatus Eremiobacterota bacterium]
MLSFLQSFSHKQEMKESRDEMLVGEIVTVMVDSGYPAIGFWAEGDFQRIRFKVVDDPVLYSITITLDRKTGGDFVSGAIFGDKATLKIICEIKNFLADPDDLLNMYKTDLQNMFKIPILGGIKLDHQLNSVLATTTKIIEIKDLILKGEEGREKLKGILFGTIRELKEKLVPYKKK